MACLDRFPCELTTDIDRTQPSIRILSIAGSQRSNSTQHWFRSIPCRFRSSENNWRERTKTTGVNEHGQSMKPRKKMPIILLRKGREDGSIDRLSLLPPKGRIMLLRRDRRPEYRPRSCLLIRSEIPSFHTHGVFTRHVHTDRMAS